MYGISIELQSRKMARRSVMTNADTACTCD